MTFLDTSFLFALVSKRDAHHARVVEVFRTFKDLRLADHLLTTNHVAAETITLTRKVGHAEAAKLGEQLYGEKLARIHWATPDDERAAFEYFKRHQDQTYSFVCVRCGLRLFDRCSVCETRRNTFFHYCPKMRSERGVAG